MPRYGIKQSVAADWLRLASIDPTTYTVELSYQTETNLFWVKMSKGGVTLPEYSTIPDLNTIDQVAVNILREGKRRLETTKTAGDYLDQSVVFPDKPAKPVSSQPPTR